MMKRAKAHVPGAVNMPRRCGPALAHRLRNLLADLAIQLGLEAVRLALAPSDLGEERRLVEAMLQPSWR